ncbi:MAG: outer membrane porin, OprD family [Terrimonas sp.]|nr:outer membrane porin, OprD family [Terrimonas sp.]
MKIKESILMVTLLLVSGQGLFAQTVPGNEKDTSTLKEFFSRGKFSAQVRTVFMNTVNKGALRDYSALAFGAGLGYETASFKGFQLGFSGFFVFNIASNNLSVPDPRTNQFSRYELGLFDLTDPHNKTNLDRLEELYIKYRYRQTQLTVGRQVLKTPFINPQDGRMRPTLEEAVWLQTKEIPHLTIQGGWINRISPRSTVDWYNIGKSIGVYSPGVDEYGKPSAYANNTQSRGIALMGADYARQETKLMAWNTFVENVMNTVFLQAEQGFVLKNKSKLLAGIQMITQYKIKEGGNPDTVKQYYPAGNRAVVISTRIGYTANKWRLNINYTRITKDGRYLMPREWGNDPFYTFMPRERNEGYGDVQAINTNFVYLPKNENWELRMGYGHFYLPDTRDFQFNKYGMPAYNQLNLQAVHHFTGFFNGLELNLLIVYKGKLGKDYDNPRYIDNKVDLIHSTLVFNYHF